MGSRRQFFLRKSCIVMLALGLAGGMYAQEKADSASGQVRRMDAVTVTARKSSALSASGSPVQQMDKTEFERIGALDLSDAVRRFSGVSVKDYGGVGGLKTISVRSLGAQHTAVSYDGVSVGDCQSGQVDISRFSLDNISLLTLDIGQSDDIYQPARMLASAGALRIQTLRPDFSRPTSLSARVVAGSYGLANPSLLLSQRLGRKVGMSAYLNYLRADGNYPFKMQNGKKAIDSKRNNSDIDAWRAEVNLFTQLTGRQDLDVKAYLYDSRRGLPGSVVYDNPYAAERLYDRNYFGQMRYENRFSDRWKLQASGKYNFSWNRDWNRLIAGDTDDRYRQTEVYATAMFWGEPVKGLSFSVAQDFVYNYLSTTLDQCQYPRRYTSLTSLSVRYRHPKVTVVGSLLNTFITEDVRTGVAAADRKRLSPSVSVSWKPVARAGWRLRASYKDIFRVPTFNDLYYLLIGNAKLKPEMTKQWNVGTVWETGFPRVVDYLKISADAYYNRVKDKIVAVPAMFVWKMSNVGKVETIGVDVSAATEMTFREGYRLLLTGNYNFMQAEDITDRKGKLWRHQIAYTPRHTATGSMTLSTPWVDLTYNVMSVSKRYSLSQNLKANRIEPYTDHGLSLSRVFRLTRRQSVRLQVDALNLGGKNYEVVRFYPMPGRNYKATVTYNL